jgi:hypothetical protein
MKVAQGSKERRVKRIVLVGCVKTKLDRPAAAKDLYQSNLFRLARAYGERFGDEWYILSAEHGLVEPDRVLAPYDTTMRDVLDRPFGEREWADGVAARLTALGAEDTHWNGVGRADSAPKPDTKVVVVFLAGELYRRMLERWFVGEVPMRGLGIGEQMAWLRRQLADAEEAAS